MAIQEIISEISVSVNIFVEAAGIFIEILMKYNKRVLCSNLESHIICSILTVSHRGTL